MRKVVVESPYAGDTGKNLSYVRAAMLDALGRNEAPYASHALYTQPSVLDDAVLQERELGIQAGFHWGALADARVLYIDLGISRGMARGLKQSMKIGQTVEFRSIQSWHRHSYLEQVQTGAVPLHLLEEAVDWWVEAWHTQQGDISVELHDFLGMSWEDYGLWVKSPDYIKEMVFSDYR